MRHKNGFEPIVKYEVRTQKVTQHYVSNIKATVSPVQL